MRLRVLFNVHGEIIRNQSCNGLKGHIHFCKALEMLSVAK